MKLSVVLEALFEIFLMISLIFIIGISTSETVSALEPDKRVCCQKTRSPDVSYCSYTAETNCDRGNGQYQVWETNRCEDVGPCKPVCCDVNNLGYTATGGQGCFKSVSAGYCKNELGGTPLPDALCNVPQCSKGCCVIGSQSTLTTKQACQDLTSQYPSLALDYREDVMSELACQNIPRSVVKGCCVKKGEGGDKATCKFSSFGECSDGEFYDGIDCINLPTGNKDCDHCKKADVTQYTTGCAPQIDGGEDVFYYDACENPVVSLKVPTGDCDYNTGSICKETKGTKGKKSAFCKSLNCNATTLWDNPFVDENQDGTFDNDNKTDTKFPNKDSSRNYRINGESWCEYDADAGPTRDLPGSRHYVHTCLEGEEQVVECAGYRDEYCVQFNGLDIDVAKCVKNKAATSLCNECDNKECCENKNIKDCVWLSSSKKEEDQAVQDAKRLSDKKCDELRKQYKDKNYPCPDVTVEVKDELSKEGKCLPLIPPGSRFWEGDDTFCKGASSTGDKALKAFWSTGGWGADWDCDSGCQLYTKKFAYGQNVLCQAQGDCGAGYNLAGKWGKEGFTRDCKLAGLDDNDYDTGDISDGEVKDYDKIVYNDQNGDAQRLVKDCLDAEKLVDPASKSDEEYNFEKLILYTNKLRIDLPPEAKSLDFWDLKAAGTVIGSSLLLVTVGVLIVGSLTSLGGFGTLLLSLGALAGIPVIGWILLAVAAAITFITLGTAKSLDQKVEFTCKTWQPPVNSNDCQLCHKPGKRNYLAVNGNEVSKDVDFTAGGKHQCTEYLCKSLGQNCQLFDTEEGARCMNSCDTKDGNKKDVNKLVITSLKLEDINEPICESKGDENTDENKPCTSENKYIKENTDIVVGVKTDELAICNWDTVRKNKFDNLTRSFDTNGASQTHKIILKAGKDLVPGDKKTMYIICQDLCGNPVTSTDPYVLNLEVSKMKDLGAPQFRGITPVSGSVVKADLTNNLSVYHSLKLNEPAMCRWSKTNDPYDLMKNEFNCRANYISGCQFTLKDVQKGENKYFIRCKDKPDTKGKSNVNIDSLPDSNGYTIIRSDALNISSFSCKHSLGEDCTKIYDSNFTLQVTTTGGGFGGRATCAYSGGDFYITNESSGISTQVLGPGLSKGNHTENIKCTDDVGNYNKELLVNYTMIVDTEAPRLLKLTTEGNTLNLLTDEEATCKYGENSTVAFIDMTPFETTETTIHSTSLGDKNYVSVQCSDRFTHLLDFEVYRAKSG